MAVDYDTIQLLGMYVLWWQESYVYYLFVSLEIIAHGFV